MQRYSEYISRKMTQNIFRAFDYLMSLRLPLNVYVVLQLRETDERSATTTFEMVRHKYRDWLSYRARKLGVVIPPMYVYSFEAPGSPHVNWVLRVPPRYLAEFQRKLPRWVERIQGPLGPFDLKIKMVAPDKPYKALANYIVKGCNPAFVDHFYLTDLYSQHGPQGEFFGKRAGVSPSLNKSARDVAGYDPKRRRIGPSKEGGVSIKGIADVA